MSLSVERGVRQLFLDDELTESVHGLARTAHIARPHPASPVFRGEMPWEHRVMPASILRDPDSGKFRMWYSDVLGSGRNLWEIDGIRVPSHRSEHGEVSTVILTCYAESVDGLQWVRPTLRQVTFEGSLENNIIDKHDREHQLIGQDTIVYFDERDPDPERRYKFYHWARRAPDEFDMLVSADGIRFRPYEGNPILSVTGDTQIDPVWSPELGKYISFGRYRCPDWPGTGRRVARIESEDLIHWSDNLNAFPAIQADEDEEPLMQFYQMKVFRYESQFVGLLNDFYVLQPPSGGELEISLATSRDGASWQRVANRQAIIRRNEEEKHIRTHGAVFVQGDEIWIYYASSPYWHGPVPGADPVHVGRSWSVRVSTLRRDGFVSWRGEEGWLQTKAFAAPAGDLFINAEVSRGQVLAEVLDGSGARLGASAPLRGNLLRGALQWRDAEGGTPPWRPGDTIALRFHLTRGHLFSYWFE